MIDDLSFFTIVHNEESLLPGLLSIMRPVAAEIVVVVQESTDKTLYHAWQYADRVIGDNHYGFMEPSLNLAHAQCTKPWLLQLDADEMPTPHLLEDLHWMVKSGNNGFHLHRINYVDDRHCIDPENPHDMQMRLWRRNRVKAFPGRRIHRTVEIHPPISSILYECIIHRKTRERYDANQLRYNQLIASGAAVQWR